MFKIFTNYIQTVSLLADMGSQMPGTLTSVLNVASAASTLKLPSTITRCAAPWLNTYTMFYVSMLMPIVGFFSTALIGEWQRSTVRRPEGKWVGGSRGVVWVSRRRGLGKESGGAVVTVGFRDGRQAVTGGQKNGQDQAVIQWFVGDLGQTKTVSVE